MERNSASEASVSTARGLRKHSARNKKSALLYGAALAGLALSSGAQAQTSGTWTLAGDSSWSDVTAWNISPASFPQNGGAAAFILPTANRAIMQDVVGLNVATLDFSAVIGTLNQYTISGNGFSVGNLSVVTSTTANSNINVPITASGTITRSGAGTASFSGAIAGNFTNAGAGFSMINSTLNGNII